MSILTSFICVLLAGFLLAVPTSRKLPNRLLAVFLTLTAIELSVWLWGHSSLMDGWVGGAWLALGKLQMPTFFFFFISSCYSDFHWKRYDALHLIPFLLALFFNFVSLPLGNIADAFSIGTRSGTILSHIIYYGYMTAIFVILFQFKRRFLLHHASGRSKVLVWLTQLAAVSLFAHTLIVLRDGFSGALPAEILTGLQMLGAVLALAITTWIALKSLLQPDLFRDVDRRLLRLQPKTKPPQNGDLDRVLRTVETHRPYLDPNLNLSELSYKLALTPRELSELLNGSIGVHFFDFINGYRVEHAKTLLLESPKRSIIQILHESGFNSKSSFNTAFKKHTGATPSAYRSHSS